MRGKRKDRLSLNVHLNPVSNKKRHIKKPHFTSTVYSHLHIRNNLHSDSEIVQYYLTVKSFWMLFKNKFVKLFWWKKLSGGSKWELKNQVPPAAVPMKTILIGGKDDTISLLACPEESIGSWEGHWREWAYMHSEELVGRVGSISEATKKMTRVILCGASKKEKKEKIPEL